MQEVNSIVSKMPPMLGPIVHLLSWGAWTINSQVKLLGSYGLFILLNELAQWVIVNSLYMARSAQIAYAYQVSTNFKALRG